MCFGRLFQNVPPERRAINHIYTYWHQGFGEAPEIVRGCVRRIQELHGEDRVSLLVQKDMDERFAEIPIREEVWNSLSIAHRSDILRTLLLIKHGGVWMDPTIFPMTNVFHWLERQKPDSGLFFFYRPGPQRILANWFIAASPGNPFLIRLFDRLCEYWNSEHLTDRSGRPKGLANLAARVLNRNLEWPRLWMKPPFMRLIKAAPYSIYHYMAYDVIRTDPQSAKIWEAMPKINAEGPHALDSGGLLNPVTEEIRRMITESGTPLYKMNWKLRSDEVPEGSTLAFLLDHGEKPL